MVADMVKSRTDASVGWCGLKKGVGAGRWEVDGVWGVRYGGGTIIAYLPKLLDANRNYGR